MLDWNKVVTLREGNTPIFAATVREECWRESGLWEHQGMNPTGSFKDTGMTAAISVAWKKIRWVACASTGNTSASMAAYAAQAGLRSLVLIPEGKNLLGEAFAGVGLWCVDLPVATDFDGCLGCCGK